MYSIGRLRVVLMSVSFSGGQILKALVSTEPLPARRPTATCCESVAHDFSLVGIARTAIFLHHQKSWLIDAGEASEVAFIGGINLTAQAVGSPGHIEGNRHDVYVEVRGPAATDAHHNFVQRWNETSDRELEGGRWGSGAEGQLPFPASVSNPQGGSVVQIQRNVDARHYSDGTASPGGAPYSIAKGEHTIFNQYLLAIDAARDAIYIENQAIPIPPGPDALEEPLNRGGEGVLVGPV